MSYFQFCTPFPLQSLPLVILSVFGEDNVDCSGDDYVPFQFPLWKRWRRSWPRGFKYHQLSLSWSLCGGGSFLVHINCSAGEAVAAASRFFSLELYYCKRGKDLFPIALVFITNQVPGKDSDWHRLGYVSLPRPSTVAKISTSYHRGPLNWTTYYSVGQGNKVFL